MAFAFPEPSLRVAPLPGRVPAHPAPGDDRAAREAAWWADHRAKADAMNAEWCELGEMLLEVCAAQEKKRVVSDAAQAFALAGLGRMLPRGSLQHMYDRIVSARWIRSPDAKGSRWLQASLTFEMWDGLSAMCWVRAEADAIRYPRPTALADQGDGEEVRRMATSPMTWWSMGWDDMEGGPCQWDEAARAWYRCDPEAEVQAA
jgi:hypothetical protein